MQPQFPDSKIDRTQTARCCEIARVFGVLCKDCNPEPKRKQYHLALNPETGGTELVPGKKPKNPWAKVRPKENPYETWITPSGWTWKVLKKWQADDNKPFARWFCFVTSPYCPDGEYGDVYVSDIKQRGGKIHC